MSATDLSATSALQGQAQSLSRMAYSDIGALRRVHGDSRAALEQAAAQFESMFVDMWLSSMREASKVFSEGSYLSSDAVEMHQEMLDHQLAVHVAQSGGVGLRDVLMRQLSRQLPESQADDSTLAEPKSSEPTTSALKTSVPNAAEPKTAGSKLAETAGGFKDALFEGASDFVRALAPVVRRVAAASGLDPVSVLAQAALETGWGSSVPHAGDGSPSFNLFGIKADNWQGRSVDVTTLEHQLQGFVRKVQSFRAYDGVADAVEDYVGLLTGSPRYASAMKVAQDPPAFADALQKAGYATDPHYADKLKALQRQIADLLGEGGQA